MKYERKFTSCTHTHVKYNLYLPVVMIRYRAVIQIHHGMDEHCGRYERFAQYLSKEGYVVVVGDFPGHGSSLFNYEQGYFGIGDAGETLVEDMQKLRTIIGRQYPDLPYFIIGNQLGSLVLRKYLARYNDFIEGAIIMGTIGKGVNLFNYYNRLFLKSVSLLKGPMYRSKRVEKVLKKQLNLSFLPIKTNVDYLTRDPQERKKYQDDPMTDFIYTSKGYNQILQLTKEVSSDTLINKIPNYLSLLIISGEKDIFGNMGIGPKWLYDKYKKNGVKDVELKIYPDCRHDLLHELNLAEVYQDILNWLNERTYI